MKRIVLDRYEMGRKLGEGAFGTVYLGVDRGGGAPVAIKHMHLSKTSTPKIEREIKILKQLDHPNLLKLLGVQYSKFECVIVTEFVEFDLLDLLHCELMPLPEALLASIWGQLADALGHLRAVGVLHRDLKPSNILISSDGSIKLADFGSAVLREDRPDKGLFEVEGFSKWYTAPDILFGSRSYSHEVDLWSAGCVLGQLVQGRPVFPGVSEIQQIFLISQLLGSPTQDNWPGIVKFPDYGKLNFVKRKPVAHQSVFPSASPEVLRQLEGCLRYEDRELRLPESGGAREPVLLQKRRNSPSYLVK